MLTPTQIEAMQRLLGGEHLTPGDIHHKTVQALVDRKLVKLAGRKPAKVLALTAKGQKELTRVSA